MFNKSWFYNYALSSQSAVGPPPGSVSSSSAGGTASLIDAPSPFSQTPDFKSPVSPAETTRLPSIRPPTASASSSPNTGRSRDPTNMSVGSVLKPAMNAAPRGGEYERKQRESERERDLVRERNREQRERDPSRERGYHQVSTSLPGGGAGPSSAAVSSAESVVTHHPDGSTKRIWAACEPCRKKRARCDGTMPCSGCLSSEAGRLGRTLQEYQAQPGSESGQEIIRKAMALCVFDWNRKKRGPRSKSSIPVNMNLPPVLVDETDVAPSKAKAAAAAAKAATTAAAAAAKREQTAKDAAEAQQPAAKKRKRARTAISAKEQKANDHGMPRSALSAGPAFLVAQRNSHHRVHSLGDGVASDDVSSSLDMPPLFAHADAPTGNADATASTVPGLTHEFEVQSSSDGASTALITPDEQSAYSFDLGRSHSKGSSMGSSLPGTSAGGLSSGPPAFGRIQLPPLQGSPVNAHHSFPSASPGLMGMPMGMAMPFGPAGIPPSPVPWIHPSPAAVHNQQMINSQISMPRRPSNSRALLSKLSRYYTEDDLPFIALSIAQFAELDAMCKLFPSKYIFGDSRNGGTLEGIANVPDHIQLALLSLLAHKCLLTPGSQSARDLDVAAAASAGGSAPASVTAHASSPSGGSAGSPFSAASALSPGTLAGWAGFEVGLTGKLRDKMLDFATRSYHHAVRLRDQEFRNGRIDARLVITGWAIDLSMSEAGATSKEMAQSKTDNLKVVLAWKLHLMDAPPEVACPMIPADLSDAPCTLGDARFSVADPVECEAVRRFVHIIIASHVWTHTMDNFTPTIDMNCMQVHYATDDDAIHHGSAWQPERKEKQPSTLLRATQYVYNMFLRVTRMLHTPLDDLVNGQGPEPDIQKAIDEIEAGLAWVKKQAPSLHTNNLDDSLRVTLFMHSRIAELISYRLFSALSSYEYLCFGWQPNPKLCVGTTLIPEADDVTSSFNKMSGATHHAALPERRLSGLEAEGQRRLRFRKDPKVACCTPLWEVEELADVINSFLFVAAPPKPKQVGTAAGVTIDRSVRAVRWPRHMRAFAQHAFAMAAEVQALGDSWSRLGGPIDPAWNKDDEPAAAPAAIAAADTSDNADMPSMQHPGSPRIPEFNSSEFIEGLWRIGSKLITLLRSLGGTGSTHAAQTAAKLEEYREQRRAWMMSQQSEFGL